MTKDYNKEVLNNFGNKVMPLGDADVKPSFNGGDANEFSKWVNERLVYIYIPGYFSAPVIKTVAKCFVATTGWNSKGEEDNSHKLPHVYNSAFLQVDLCSLPDAASDDR